MVGTGTGNTHTANQECKKAMKILEFSLQSFAFSFFLVFGSFLFASPSYITDGLVGFIGLV